MVIVCCVWWMADAVLRPAAARGAGAGGGVNPIEAGDVHWNRDLDGMLERSRNSGKPLFVLFQEIPGCIGCKNFGRDVLTQPLLVEAIEDEFLPVLVYNNRFGGDDARYLERFGEPSWNFQVVRFLDGRGQDIIPRRDRVWTVSELAQRMVAVLERIGRQPPRYLRNLALEYDRENHGKIGFSMACFWTGEYRLGKVEGVVWTEAGWFDHREVTLVSYHRGVVTLEDLVRYAEREQCAQRVYPMTAADAERVQSRKLTLIPFREEAYEKAGDSDQKKQLSLWPELAGVSNLTPMQRTKLNSLAPDDRALARDFLSPRQRAELDNAENGGKPIGQGMGWDGQESQLAFDEALH